MLPVSLFFLRLCTRIVTVAAATIMTMVASHGQSVVAAEYFFDFDPGHGNGTAIAVSPGPTVNFTANIPLGSLPAGFHFLGIRVKESGGIWSIFEWRGLYITTTQTNVGNVVAAEYFLDVDPGPGNGVAVAVPPGATTNFSINVSTTSLSPGFHFIGVRTKAPSNRWSIFEARGFYVTTSTANVTNIAAAEYFIDLDPGPGNGTALTVPQGATSSFTVGLPLNTLQPGFHFLGIRTRSLSGQWGHFEARGFYVTSAVANVAGIVAAEYFIDTDPGTGTATQLSIPGGSNPNFTVAIPATGLNPGFHTLAIRVRDAAGKWSNFENRGFYVVPGSNNNRDIVAAEYYIDSDPGIGLATPIPISTPVAVFDESLLIPVSGVGTGVHTLGIRVRDSNGSWSEYLEDEFTVLNCTPPPAPTGVNGSRCNEGTVSLSATGAAPGQQYRWYAGDLDLTALGTGDIFTTPEIAVTTDFFVGIFDPITLCESTRTKVTALVVPVEKPVLNASGNIQLCEGSSFLLSAPPGFTSYLWSDGSQTQQLLITTGGTYTVAISTATCALPVSDPVTIDFVSKPPVPVVVTTGQTEACQAASVALTAPAGFNRYLWNTGETTPSITATTAGNYTLTVENAAGCKSDPSAPVVVKIFNPPARPVITVTGLETLCEDDFAVLSAPSGFTQYEWSNGATTQSIVVSESGTFSVRTAVGASCFSALSDPVTIVQTGTPCGSVINPGNSAPEIANITATAAIQGQVNIGLRPYLSDVDGDDDIDLASLRITMAPASGAPASIGTDQQLVVDYTGTSFTGSDFLIIQVCDKSGSCTQGQIVVSVAGDIVAYNALSPNGDGLNEALTFEFIDLLPDTRSNTVTVYNRWGTPVIRITDYDNRERVFRGLDSNGNELPNGTYFYQITFSSGRQTKDGFITLRR